MSKEQKLIDLMFEVALTVRDRCVASIGAPTREEVTVWVSDWLRQSGFEMRPSGSAWGVLDKAPVHVSAPQAQHQMTRQELALTALHHAASRRDIEERAETTVERARAFLAFLEGS